MDATNHLPPDETSLRYEGWRIVAVCFLISTFGWGLGFYGQSVYLAELQRVHGWPASLISAGTTFFYLFGALVVVFVAEAMRAFGPRRCLIAGVLAMATAALALGQVRELWQLYLADALLAFGWAGTTLAMISNTVSLWFADRRGMAISLALNGASFGGIAGVPLLVFMIAHLGFAMTMTLVALVMIVVVVPIVAFSVGRPPLRDGGAKIVQSSAREIRKEALRDVGFLSIAISFALVLFAQVAFVVHLISFLDPVIGRAPAALAVSLLTIMAMVGRVSLSTVIDRLDQRLASAVSFASQAVALVVIINSNSAPVLIGACVVYGFSVGNLITLPSLIVQREFDAKSFGVLISLSTAITQVTYAFGPGVVGLLRDLSGSYVLPFYGCIALELIAAMLIMVRGRRIRSAQL